MSETRFEYAKYCNSGRLTKEIQLSEIPKMLDYITTVAAPAKTTIVFKEALGQVYIDVLNAIVTAHVATPLAEVTAQAVTVQSSPSYGAKTVVLADGSTRKLFARNLGVIYPLIVGENNLSYTATFPWVKVTGIEVVGCEIGDFADFMVYDTPLGSYSGYPNALLNKFAYSVNLPNGFYERASKFDADLYQGMVIRMKYTSVSMKNVGINYLMDEVKA